MREAKGWFQNKQARVRLLEGRSVSRGGGSFFVGDEEAKEKAEEGEQLRANNEEEVRANNEEEVTGLHIFGDCPIPVTPGRCRYPPSDPRRHAGFNREPEQLAETWSRIPAGLHVLVTHGPPLGKNCYCHSLLSALTKPPVARFCMFVL
jgi:hypothetical protein